MHREPLRLVWRRFGPLAPGRVATHVQPMLNILSILIGLVALVFAIPGLVPLLGWINWLVLPLALLGAGLGALSSRTAGRNLNIIVLIVGIARLMLGGGFV